MLESGTERRKHQHLSDYAITIWISTRDASAASTD